MNNNYNQPQGLLSQPPQALQRGQKGYRMQQRMQDPNLDPNKRAEYEQRTQDLQSSGQYGMPKQRPMGMQRPNPMGQNQGFQGQMQPMQPQYQQFDPQMPQYGGAGMNYQQPMPQFNPMQPMQAPQGMQRPHFASQGQPVQQQFNRGRFY